MKFLYYNVKGENYFQEPSPKNQIPNYKASFVMLPGIWVLKFGIWDLINTGIIYVFSITKYTPTVSSAFVTIFLIIENSYEYLF